MAATKEISLPLTQMPKPDALQEDNSAKMLNKGYSLFTT